MDHRACALVIEKGEISQRSQSHSGWRVLVRGLGSGVHGTAPSWSGRAELRYRWNGMGFLSLRNAALLRFIDQNESLV